MIETVEQHRNEKRKSFDDYSYVVRTAEIMERMTGEYCQVVVDSCGYMILRVDAAGHKFFM